jgi:hypothetical protein
MPPDAPIVLVAKPLGPALLARLVGHPFEDMVKFVADVRRKIVAVGGELHADAEELLLEDGSNQALPCAGGSSDSKRHSSSAV